MTITFIVTFILIVVPTLALLFPRDTLSIVAELKRQLRHRLIQSSGTQAAQELAQSFRRRALAKGYDPELIEEVLAEHYGIIVERLGKKRADEILGESTPIERYD